MRQYETEDGYKRNATDFIVDDVEFLTSKSNDTNESESNKGFSKKHTLQAFDDDDSIPF